MGALLFLNILINNKHNIQEEDSKRANLLSASLKSNSKGIILAIGRNNIVTVVNNR